MPGILGIPGTPGMGIAGGAGKSVTPGAGGRDGTLGRGGMLGSEVSWRHISKHGYGQDFNVKESHRAGPRPLALRKSMNWRLTSKSGFQSYSCWFPRRW